MPDCITPNANIQKHLQISYTELLCLSKVDFIDRAICKEDCRMNRLCRVEYLMANYENDSKTESFPGLMENERQEKQPFQHD